MKNKLINAITICDRINKKTMQLQKIETKIYEIRGLKIMLDYDLAELYQVETKNLNLAVKRNLKRFPTDFMFQITKIEWDILRLQIATSNDSLRSQNETSNKRGGTRYLPYAFTEQGLAMLSGILNSDIAIEVHISIMRAFVMIRHISTNNQDLMAKLKEIENKFNKQFKDVFEAINYLLEKDKAEAEQKKRRQIGFK